MIWFREDRNRCNQNANRKTEEKVGLYQTTKTNYTNSNNGLNFLIQKVRKILLICKRSILEFLNDEFISVGTVNFFIFMVFIFNKLIIILTWTYVRYVFLVTSLREELIVEISSS